MQAAGVDPLSTLSVYSQSLDEVLDRHGLQRISLLREIAVKTGIQVGHHDQKHNLSKIVGFLNS